VAWTIADLEESPLIRASHLSEALHYRVGERERRAPGSDDGVVVTGGRDGAV